jgi:hypothetical protein
VVPCGLVIFKEGEPMRKVLAILIILVWPLSAWAGVTYYVSNANPVGSDSDSGTSTSTPWLTINKVNTSTFSPGDSILFNRGCTWQEQLTVPASGSPGSPIAFGAYGSGSVPIFYGGLTIVSGSWVANDPVAGVYSWYYGNTYPNALWEDSVPAVYASSSSCTDGNWFIGPGLKIHYKPTSGTPANHTVEYAQWAGIDINLNSYITINELSFSKYYNGIISQPYVTADTSYITVSNCTFVNMPFGITISTNHTNASNISIFNNTLSYVGENIFVGAYNCEVLGGTLNNVMIYNNTLTYQAQCYGTNRNWFTSLGSFGDIEGIGVQNLTNSDIFGNTISGLGRGIYNYVCANSTTHDNNIYDNYISTQLTGLLLAGANAGTSYYNNNAYYNILYSCGALDSSTAAIYIGNVTSPTVMLYNHLYNNTIVTPMNSIYAGGTSVYWVVENNISYSPSSSHVIESSSAANISFNYNLYYPDSSTAFAVNGIGKTFAQWQALGFDANSATPANPLFINAETDFHLQSGSPAIGAGTDVGLTTDYAGNAVPSVPDIGAYQFLPALQPPNGLRLTK